METIIIYTKYYLQAVEEILNNHDLNIQILSFPSYKTVYEKVKTTPNLRGVIFLEHRTGFRSAKAYKSIITALDEIAEASKQPMCVSIISNTDAPKKIISKMNTSCLTIYNTKFSMMHTDTLKFEGLATIIANTIGVENDSILLELDKETMEVASGLSLNKLEFIQSCLEVVSLPTRRLGEYAQLAEKLPELGKLIHLRQSSDNDEEILRTATGLTKIFAKHAIEGREEQDD